MSCWNHQKDPDHKYEHMNKNCEEYQNYIKDKYPVVTWKENDIRFNDNIDISLDFKDILKIDITKTSLSKYLKNEIKGTDFLKNKFTNSESVVAVEEFLNDSKINREKETKLKLFEIQNHNKLRG